MDAALEELGRQKAEELKNYLVQLEDAVTAFVAEISASDEVDRRFVAIARTQFDLAFLALGRGLKPLYDEFSET